MSIVGDEEPQMRLKFFGYYLLDHENTHDQ